MTNTHFKFIFNIFTLFALLTALLGSVTPAYAAGIVVNSALDDTLTNLNANTTCDLREAIVNANNNVAVYSDCATGSAGVDTITFAANYTITLATQFPAIVPNSIIVITGKGAANTILQANATPSVATFRLFETMLNSDLTLDSVTIRNGSCVSECNTVVNSGGGVYNNGSLTVINSLFSENGATYGGGIDNHGTLIIADSLFSKNNSLQGGAIRNHDGIVNMTNTTISDGFGLLGGGISNSSTLTIENSLFFNNSSINGYGGGINNNGALTITNTTFSKNIAFLGGGLNNDSGTADITNSTFSDNGAIVGSGINNSNTAILNLTNTILANSTVSDCEGLVNVNLNNLIKDPTYTCGMTNGVNGNIVGVDPKLGVLANRGGATQTVALLFGSPAIDTGTNASCPATDQRGTIRPQGAACDIGAYELYKYGPLKFEDVPLTYWANSYIERLANAGITGGCSAVPLNYCPDSSVTRAQMAIFILKSMHGASYTPPAVGSSTGFSDVPVGAFADAWIKQLAAEGITSGCGNGNYCPDATVTRASMAIFLLKAKYGTAFNPSAATGVFSDVPVGTFADKWIEQLASEGITGGCGTGTYCPDNSVTRAQMAVFLVKTFNLP